MFEAEFDRLKTFGMRWTVRPVAKIGPAIAFGFIWQRLNQYIPGFGEGADGIATAIGAALFFWYYLVITSSHDLAKIAREMVVIAFGILVGRVVFSILPPWNNSIGAAIGATIGHFVYASSGEDGRFVHARGTVMLSLAEARKRIAVMVVGAVLKIRWAGEDLPESVSQGNILVAGGIGTGKTRLVRELMRSTLPNIRAGSDLRALIYDVKSDLIAELRTMGLSCDVIVFNPFDKRSLAWDIAADVQSPNAARHFARALILDSPNDKQFFTTACRNIVAGVINVLNDRVPGQWTLRDLIRLTATKERLLRVLAGTDLIGRYKDPPETFENVINTIGNVMVELESVAALWERTPRYKRISFKRWVKEADSILVFGGKEDLQESLEPLNRVAFKMIAQEFMSGRESARRSRMWFFCDELKTAGRLDALPMMLNARSKGVRCVLGFQDIEGLDKAYGSREEAMEILNRCATVSWLKLTSPETAQWASDRTGAVERWEYTTTQTKDGTSTGESLVNRESVLPSEFMNLSETDGIANGIHRIRGLGGVFKSQVPYKFPDTKAQYDFIPWDGAEPTLDQWGDDDWARLGFNDDDGGEDAGPVVLASPSPVVPTAPAKPSFDLDDIGRVTFT